ncbi:protein kinase domain-containing protein [Krasilnikovia sp. M28-CT-15]|uniref:serine/threonine-protein kinase n=1 Tax=Krasilnikovia sp. M28-CT-15 TaxID=3373540 RepID=UPI003875E424
MGRVWLARDEMLDRDVAVKEFVPPAWMNDDEKGRLRTRTLREARSAARLNHPHVVRIYDVVHADGLPWIVMEYIESRSLFQVVREDGPFSPAAAARIGLAVLDALTAAHRAGVLHRDVKPHNVLIGHDGRVVLTDFGLATFVDEGSVTGPGMIVGSPHYVSPERARDGASTVESDLWSLGATLYAAVEARSPYARASVMATLLALASEEPDPPVRAGPLRPVLLGLLRRDPADRLTAAEVAEGLAAIVAVAEGRGPGPARRRAMLGLMTVPAPRRPGRVPVPEPAPSDDGAVRRWIAGRGRTAAVFPPSPPGPASAAGAEQGPVGRLPDPAVRNASPAAAAPPRQRPGNHPPRAAGRLRSAVPPTITGPPAQRTGGTRILPGPGEGPPAPARAAPGHLPASPAARRAVQIGRGGRDAAWPYPRPQQWSGLAGASPRPRPSAPGPTPSRGRSSSPDPSPLPDTSSLSDLPHLPGLVSLSGPSTVPDFGPSPTRSLSPPGPPERRAHRRPPRTGGQTRSRLVAAGLAVLAVLAAASSPVRHTRHGDQNTAAVPVASAERMPGSIRLLGSGWLAGQVPGSSGGQGGADGFSPTTCANPPGTDLPRTPQRGAGRGMDDWSVPPGWTYFTDTPGFRLAVPDGWTYERVGTTVCFRDPGGDRYLSIDPDRDPAADPVQACRAEAQRLADTGVVPGYQQLGIEPVPLSARAADWEFRYEGAADQPVHVMTRWLAVAGRAYALGWATPEPDWTDSWDTYATIRGTFSLDGSPGGSARR